jgi:hypothetical protein
MPVVNDEMSEAKYSTVEATSSGVPIRPSGVMARQAASVRTGSPPRARDHGDVLLLAHADARTVRRARRPVREASPLARLPHPSGDRIGPPQLSRVAQ